MDRAVLVVLLVVCLGGIVVPSSLTEISVCYGPCICGHCSNCTMASCNITTNYSSDSCSMNSTNTMISCEDTCNNEMDLCGDPSETFALNRYIIIIGALGVTNLITIITLCGVALLYLLKCKIASKRIRNSDLHQAAEYKERVVNNPAYEEQCTNLDAVNGCACSQPTELSAQYTTLGPAYDSIRSVNQRARVVIKEDLFSNKRPLRHTEPMNYPRTYHEACISKTHQKRLPNDDHSYSRLYH